jgi:hypothetical protein
MHVALSRNETHKNFNICVYGDEKLVRGSGLFVGEAGVAANHHFLTPRDGSGFRFTEGRYRLEVFAHLLGDKVKTRLFSQTLENLAGGRNRALCAGRGFVLRLGAGLFALSAPC